MRRVKSKMWRTRTLKNTSLHPLNIHSSIPQSWAGRCCVCGARLWGESITASKLPLLASGQSEGSAATCCWRAKITLEPPAKHSQISTCYTVTWTQGSLAFRGGIQFTQFTSCKPICHPWLDYMCLFNLATLEHKARGVWISSLLTYSGPVNPSLS